MASESRTGLVVGIVGALLGVAGIILAIVFANDSHDDGERNKKEIIDAINRRAETEEPKAQSLEDDRIDKERSALSFVPDSVSNPSVDALRKEVERYKHYRECRETKDPQRRAACYRESCPEGTGWACNNLGHMYLQGKGVRKDPREALVWFKKGCDDFGLSQACENAAGLAALRPGDGVNHT